MQDFRLDPKPWYKRRWFRVGVLLLGLAFVAMWLGSSVLVKPDDVLLDAMEHALKTPGTYRVTSSVANGSLTVTRDSMSWSGSIGAVNVDAILTGDALYAKSPTPDGLYAMVGGGSAELGSAIRALAGTVSNQWIKIDLHKNQLGPQMTRTLQCISGQKTVLQDHEDARRQWRDALGNTSFWIVRKSTDSTATTAYQLLMDAKARTEFLSGLQQTQYYQSVATCADSLDLSRIAADKWLNATVTLSQPAHVIQSVVVDLGTGGKMTITPNYQTPNQVVVPADAMTIDQLLINYLKSLFHAK